MPAAEALPVAVVIPTRDRPEALSRAVASVLAQTSPPAEVVVVDDGSLRPVELPAPVRVLRSQGVGAAAARNLGVAATTAPLVAFLDDDDRWRPRKLERQLAALGACGADVAAVECGFDLWEDGRLLMRYLPEARRDLRRLLLERPALQPSTVLLRRSAFDELGGFDAAISRTEDWDLWLRLADRYRVETIPEVHVDRAHNRDVPAAELLEAYAGAVARFSPRIAALPGRERRGVEATHAFMLGVLAADAGERRRAAGSLLAALVRDPRRLRALAHLVRVLAGERVWALLYRGGAAARGAALRFAGRDAAVRRW